MSYALNLGCSRLPYGMRECDIGRDEAPEPDKCLLCDEVDCICDDGVCVGCGEEKAECACFEPPTVGNEVY